MLLNIGGALHQVKWETIDKFPKSRLQKLRYATTQGKTKSTVNFNLKVSNGTLQIEYDFHRETTAVFGSWKLFFID